MIDNSCQWICLNISSIFTLKYLDAVSSKKYIKFNNFELSILNLDLISF